MAEVERLEAELAVAKIQEQYEALRAEVEDPATHTDENMAEYRRLNDELAKARTEFKQKFGPPPAAPGDAQATPEAIQASAGTTGNGGAAQ
jgi:hypothetical protein